MNAKGRTVTTLVINSINQQHITLLFLIGFFLLVAGTPIWAADVSIADGDTLILDGVVYRLDGIEAPQTDQTCLDEKGSFWTCGIAARDQLIAYVQKRNVRCDDKGPDKAYRNRRISICRIEGEPISINQWMVRNGWALPVGLSAKKRFKTESDYARSNRMGLWKGCFVAPEALRRFTISTTSLLGTACPSSGNWRIREALFPDYPAMPPGCTIKGRIRFRAQVAGYTGIYHLKSCRSYRRTKNPHRWFCSEEEAKAEGFRKSYTC